MTWVDGLQQSEVEADFFGDVSNPNQTGAPYVGVDLDSSTATPEFFGFIYGVASSNPQAPISGKWSFNPQLGLHFAQAVEEPSSASVQGWFGAVSGVQVEILQLHVAM